MECARVLAHLSTFSFSLVPNFHLSPIIIYPWVSFSGNKHNEVNYWRNHKKFIFGYIKAAAAAVAVWERN
jgi:hypothetical protein